jgi:hypothetical protein
MIVRVILKARARARARARVRVGVMEYLYKPCVVQEGGHVGPRRGSQSHPPGGQSLPMIGEGWGYGWR